MKLGMEMVVVAAVDVINIRILVNGAIDGSCCVLLFEDDTVPGKASLIYDVELLEIEKGQRPANFFSEIDTDGDNLLSQDEVVQMIFVDLCNDMMFKMFKINYRQL